MPKNIFQHDHRVIDQSRKRQRQPSEHHGVDGAASSANRQKCSQSRKWNRQKHCSRGAHASQKQQNHQSRQDQSDSAFVDQIVDRRAHENRLVEHHAGLQLFRNVHQMHQRVLDSFHHRNRIGIASLLQDRQIHRRLPIHAHDVGLNRFRVDGFANIADQYRRLPHRFQWHGIDGFCRRCLAVGI